MVVLWRKTISDSAKKIEPGPFYALLYVSHPAMHRTGLAFLILLQAIVAGPSEAQEGRPPSGVTIDEARVVTLLTELPPRCVSLESNGVTIVLDRDKVEAAGEVPNGIKWKTAEERLALINGGRARELLAHVSENLDEVGCSKLAVTGRDDASFFIGRMLEMGSAGIFVSGGDRTLLKTVRVRYSAFRASPTFGRGEIQFYAPDANLPFFVMLWWAS